jgi:hypothetical protein
MNVHWKRTLQMMMMMMMMISLRIMCPGIGRTTVSHSVVSIVRMCPRSTRRMRLHRRYVP